MAATCGQTLGSLLILLLGLTGKSWVLPRASTEALGGY